MADATSEFTAESYRVVAEEHLEALEPLYNQGFYGLALYVAGLAVESMLRAYRMRLDPQFDSRHDLHELAKAARFDDLIPKGQALRYAAALIAVATRWSSTHRYRSETAIRAYLKRGRLDRGIKGDFLKENARRAINGAAEVVKLGALRWRRF